MKYMTSTPKIHGVVAVEESSGAIMADGFIHSGEVHGVGPIFAGNAFKGRGAAKAVMVSIIEKANSENAKSIRLCQTTANVVSFSLYASLGFVSKECWVDLEGSVTSEQASSANRSVGFHPLAGLDVRRMEDADVDACKELHIKIMSFDRGEDIRAENTSWVAVEDGRIIAYTTGFSFLGHAVVYSEETLAFLFTEVCRKTDNASSQSFLHLPGSQAASEEKLLAHGDGLLRITPAWDGLLPQHDVLV